MLCNGPVQLEVSVEQVRRNRGEDVHVKRPIWMALVGVAVAVLAPPVLGWVAARFVPPARPDNIAQPPGYEALDRYLEQQLGRLNVPGAAVAVVDGDQIVHERGFGQGRRGGRPHRKRPLSLARQQSRSPPWR
jgi:hypothetical protein